MCTGFTKDTNQYFSKPSPVRKGDYIEFLGKGHELPRHWPAIDSSTADASAYLHV
jgi:hypothetical protein